MSGLDNSYFVIKFLAIIPIGFLVGAILLLIQVLRSRPLDQGFHVNKLDELVNKPYEEILLYEIGANKSSFIDNQAINEKSNNRYNRAIKFTVISIILSTVLLLLNEFFKPKQEPIKIIISNPINMSNDSNKNSGNNNEKPRVIPNVPPKDRMNLNEGVNNPKPTTQQPDKEDKK